MKKLLATLLLIGSLGYAGAQSSKVTLDAEIDTNWPNNTTGAITPAILRSTVKDIVASYVDWLTCTTQGGILYWDNAAAPACLTAGSAGYLLKSGGASANPSWQANTAASITVATNFRFIGNAAGNNQVAQELSANTLFDWLSATRGDIFYRGASAWAGLPASTTGSLLRTNGAGADPSWATLTSILDLIGSTRGNVLYRGAASWQVLTPSTLGFVLQTNGAGADPSWNAVAGTGTVQTITCSTAISCTSNPITVSGTISADIASAAQVQAATAAKLVDGAGMTQAGALATLTSISPTIAVDFSTGVNFALSVTGAVQLGNPSNAAAGRTGCIFITKDLTTRTLSYNSNWKFAGGTAPTLSTTTTTVPDALCYLVRSSTFIWATMTKAIQ